jgi:uncharacterized membrane protein
MMVASSRSTLEPTRRCAVRRVLALALAGGLVFAPPAAADLKLCNTTSSRIGVAIGYQDSGGWTTEGWWNIASRACETLFKGPLSSRFWYIHAIDYDRGGEWAGNASMCTADVAFTIRGVQDCARRGYNNNGFFEVDTLESKDWTIRLTDPSEGGAKPK